MRRLLGSAVGALGAWVLSSRRLMRLPIRAYHLGWGRLFGERMLLLEHTGRRSGLAREVVLEVVARPRPGCYVVTSGFGGRAQWYRNILADPRVRISTGHRSSAPAIARQLRVDEAGTALAGYLSAHRRAWSWLGPAVERTLGRPIDTTSPPPMVRFELVDPETNRPDGA